MIQQDREIVIRRVANGYVVQPARGPEDSPLAIAIYSGGDDDTYVFQRKGVTPDGCHTMFGWLDEHFDRNRMSPHEEVIPGPVSPEPINKETAI